MLTKVSVASEVKNLLSQIETLARQGQSKLASGTSVLDVANELVSNSVKFTFALGELYALDVSGVNTGTVSSKPARASQSNFHNLRDNRGRFARVVRP